MSCAVLCPPAASNDCGSVLAVSVSEAVDSPVPGWGLVTRGQPREGQYRSVWWPPPALSDNSNCVIAMSAEVGSVPLTEEAAIQS